MKKIFAFALSLALIGCDDNPVRTETVVVEKPKTTVQTNITKKTVILAKGAVYDTIRTKFENNSIVGKIDSVNGAIVCSDKMNRCAKTNIKGVYQINLPSRSLNAGRIYEGIDTVSTPENVDLSPGDTTVTPSGKDTNIVSDTLIDSTVTVSGNDTLIVISIEVIDSIKSADSIKVEISEPTPVAIKDTLSVVFGGTVLREIPITSWGNILPTNYIVQRNIDVIDGTKNKCIVKVDAVYYLEDSILKVVSLEELNNVFSGFIYTYYNDSSYRNETKMYKIFIRGYDSTMRLVSVTNVDSFSERKGDISGYVLTNNIVLPKTDADTLAHVAEKNKKIKDVLTNNLGEFDTLSWVGLNNIQFLFDSIKVVNENMTMKDGRVISYSGYLYLLDNNEKQINYDSLNLVKISFKMETSADSVLFSGNLVPKTNNNEYSFNLSGKGFAYIGTWAGGSIHPAKITNIRFYFKQN